MSRSLGVVIRGLALLFVVGLNASPAAAGEVESWNLVELRVPVPDHAAWWPRQIRFVTSSRLGAHYPGLGVSSLRAGPIWEVAPWLAIAAHGSAYAEQASPGLFRQNMRLELEPNVRGVWGHLHLNDRNRLEWRHDMRAPTLRYRNQLRASFQEPTWEWWPTASTETHWELGSWTVMQQRLSLGVSRPLNDATRLTLEYLARWRPDAVLGGTTDHILNLTLFFAPSLADVEGQGYQAGD